MLLFNNGIALWFFNYCSARAMLDFLIHSNKMLNRHFAFFIIFVIQSVRFGDSRSFFLLYVNADMHICNCLTLNLSNLSKGLKTFFLIFFFCGKNTLGNFCANKSAIHANNLELPLFKYKFAKLF